MSEMAHFFVVISGSKIHERVAHFFIDIYKKNKQTSSISLKASKLAVFLAGSEFRLRIPFGKLLTAQEGAAGEACFA